MSKVLTIKAFSLKSDKQLINKMAVVRDPNVVELRTLIADKLTHIHPHLLNKFDAYRDIKEVITTGLTDAAELLDSPLSLLLENVPIPPPPQIKVTIDVEEEAEEEEKDKETVAVASHSSEGMFTKMGKDAAKEKAQKEKDSGLTESKFEFDDWHKILQELRDSEKSALLPYPIPVSDNSTVSDDITYSVAIGEENSSPPMVSKEDTNSTERTEEDRKSSEQKGNATMDMIGTNLSRGGKVLSHRELVKRRIRKGECPTCGQKCFEKKLFNRVKPLTIEGKVLRGQCLVCNPLDTPFVETTTKKEDDLNDSGPKSRQPSKSDKGGNEPSSSVQSSSKSESKSSTKGRQAAAGGKATASTVFDIESSSELEQRRGGTKSSGKSLRSKISELLNPRNNSNKKNTSQSEKTPVNFILNLTDDKPLDALDVTDLNAAKTEIQHIRKFAAEYLATIEDTNDEQKEDDKFRYNSTDDMGVRGALYDKQDFSSFKKVSCEKTDDIRSLIYNAIKPNVLFENDSQDEILQIIDVFKPQTFKKGEHVIKQGDEGSEFYVVESGSLNIHVTVKGEGEEESSEVKVGEYSKGSAFGELALIFGSPRAATITATSDCKLWSIERMSYRSVISQLRYEQQQEKNAFIRQCEVSGRMFTDIFDDSQLDDLTIAMKVDVYEEGQVIIREGEMGDTFYIVKCGSIERYRNDKNGDEKLDGVVDVKKSFGTTSLLGSVEWYPNDKNGDEKSDGVVEVKKSFGSTSLLKGAPSPLTYRAASTVQLYYLTRKDFEEIVGSFKDALDGTIVSRSTRKSKSKRTIKTSASYLDRRYECEFDELDFFNILGKGAFGQVTLVQSKKTKKVFALKALSKHYIAKKNQKEHVLNEYRIMKEIEHPCILGIHCAMQDKQHLYFLLDLLPGGELMPYLARQARQSSTPGGFNEDVTRFYAASVVLAFEQLHECMIAYRDLKPENIVLTKKGYGVLVDFGLAKEIDDGQTYTFCGTPDYLAPEIIRGTGHDWAVDYWGLGVFLFEMTNGTAPFYAPNQARRTRKILKGFEYVRVPSHFSGGLTDLISNLLVNDQSKRLGRTQNGVQNIKSHRWFAGFDWDSFGEQTLEAPIQPKLPADIKKLGRKMAASNAFKDAEFAPDSDWWPDLSNLQKDIIDDSMTKQLAARDVLGPESLVRFTLRTLIQKGIKMEDSSIDNSVVIQSVSVDQSDAFDLLDLPLSYWLRSTDTPKIEVSATYIDKAIKGSMRMDGGIPLHQISEE